MKTVKYEVTYADKAGRLELFIRWIWAIPTTIVLILVAILASISMFLQFFHVLILGKRNKMLHDWINMYIAYHTKYCAYQSYLTDERNPIMPE
ncbi:Uncharacterised protein [Candidatus Anstonella stagnisolia]|nr:Uncharacterised protein [Candidatus Anstonella stagnisolia]